MRKIRIGNDIQVSWEVKTNGEAVSLEGRTLKLYVRSAYQKQEITNFTISGCVITFLYPASMQKSTGSRAVILNDATTGSPEKTICADQAFTLVAHSCEESDDDVDFEDFMVSLKSNIALCSPEMKRVIDGKFDKVEETKVDKTELEAKAEEIRRLCFKLGDRGQVAGACKTASNEFANGVIAIRYKDYQYAAIDDDLPDNELPLYIYDKTEDKVIEITKNNYISSGDDTFNSGDYFNTDEPLDLSHKLYLDSKKTGDIDNLDELSLESGYIMGFQYLCQEDTLEDNEAPQYIYDADDRKWITVTESLYISDVDFFNTDEPLDLSHDLLWMELQTFYIYSQATGDYSTALGYNSQATGDYSTALGCNSQATGNSSIALGYNSRATGYYSTALGYNSQATEEYSTALGCNSQASFKSIALGRNANAGVGNNITYNSCITIGESSASLSTKSITIGCNNQNVGAFGSTIIGFNCKDSFGANLLIGNDIESKNRNSIIIGYNMYLSKIACYSLALSGIAIMEVDRDKKGIFIKGLGGYTGTNLAKKNGDTEILNPDIKSVQEIINEKADKTDIREKLNAITDATTADEVVTKFNALLADLKAKGYMKNE